MRNMPSGHPALKRDSFLRISISQISKFLEIFQFAKINPRGFLCQKSSLGVVLFSKQICSFLTV